MQVFVSFHLAIKIMFTDIKAIKFSSGYCIAKKSSCLILI